MDHDGNGWVRKRLDEPRDAGERSAATFIDYGADFDGTLRLTESFRIDGEFRGSIESLSTVIVGEAAGIEAHVHGRDVIIAGAVVGNVTATRQLTLRAGARVHGNIETPSLEVERGAMLNGSTRMLRPDAAARAGARITDAAAPAAPPTTTS